MKSSLSLLRTEYNPITRSGGACKSAGGVILRIRESIAAPRLEKPGQIRRTARPRVAAIIRRLVHRARVVASPGSPECIRALPRDVRRASHGAGAPVRGGPELNRHVESF